MQEYLNKVSKESGVDIFLVKRMYEIEGLDRLLNNIEDYIWEAHSVDQSNEIGMYGLDYQWKYTKWEKM